MSLGGNRSVEMAETIKRAEMTARAARSAARAEDLAQVINELEMQGVTSLAGIAQGLNSKGIPTARGGRWTATQVMRVVTNLSGGGRHGDRDGRSPAE